MFQAIETNTNKATFEMHDVDLAVANAIRRTILTDIPVVGFRGEDSPSLNVLKNNGPLHNEFMLHRFGLIPIHFNDEIVESFNTDDYEFELYVENKGASMLNVTTKDFKVRKHGSELPAKEVTQLFPANPVTKEHILITRLRQGEELHVKGQAVLDIARSHAGFSPGFCTFSYMQDPVKAASATNVLDKERAYKRNEHGDPVAYQFRIESVCGLTPYYLVHKSLQVLRKKLDKIQTELYQDPSEYVTVRPWAGGVNETAAGEMTGMEFVFQNEDDTLGSLLQSLMYNHYIREKHVTERGRNVAYVGYVCPHPLERTMILRIVFEEDAPIVEYIEALAEQCRRIDGELQNVQSEWARSQPE